MTYIQAIFKLIRKDKTVLQFHQNRMNNKEIYRILKFCVLFVIKMFLYLYSTIGPAFQI